MELPNSRHRRLNAPNEAKWYRLGPIASTARLAEDLGHVLGGVRAMKCVQCACVAALDYSPLGQPLGNEPMLIRRAKDMHPLRLLVLAAKVTLLIPA